ncbi:MAG: ATP-binding cassette domain-containing protein, partial [Limisphaerales bacterium]
MPDFPMNVSINPSATAAPPAQKPAGPLALMVRNLSVFFGTNKVLKDVSLDIAARAVTAIIGPSGCGKSTFLRAVNRMHELNPEARM